MIGRDVAKLAERIVTNVCLHFLSISEINSKQGDPFAIWKIENEGKLFVGNFWHIHKDRAAR